MQLPITIIIIIITSLVSIGAFSNEKITNDLIFYPPAISKQGQWYRFFTNGLIHADWMHLIFNMLSLYFFYELVEGAFLFLFGTWGKWLYLGMYISALMICLLPTYLKNKENYSYYGLGASGAVSAVIFAGLLLIPTAPLQFFFLPFVKIPGFIFAPLYLLFSAYMDKRGTSNINHSAHIWGAFYGMAFIIIGCYSVGYPIIANFVNAVKGYLHI